MPTEALILRRVFPVPVTFADLRAAALDMSTPPWWADSWMQTKRSVGDDGRALIMRWWHDAIKEATGALDEVYALIDGREVRVATVTGSGETATANILGGVSAGQVAEVLIAADEAGYWERPHEVRVDLQERPVTMAAVERAVNVGWCAKGGAA